MDETQAGGPKTPAEYMDTELLRLRIDKGLYRAFQRCSWIIIHETGRSQMDVMNEMVHDFLVKHQC